MRTFIVKLARYLSIVAIIIVVNMGLSILIADKYGHLSTSYGHTITANDIFILGNSHPQCAINDSLLPNNFHSVAKSSEALFYSCIKARFILKQHIRDTMIIEFTNNSLYTIDWVISDSSLIRNHHYHFAKMAMEDNLLLFKENKIKTIKSYLSLSPLAAYKSSLLDGGYLFLKRNEVVQKIRNFQNRVVPDTINPEFTAEQEAINFNKLTQLIDDYPKTTFILIRSPMHHSYEYFGEANFLKHVTLLEAKPNAIFIDFAKEYTFADRYFGDAEHLNHLGASLFTPIFLQRIKTAKRNEVGDKSRRIAR
jgi:hypothetical protein